MFGLMILFTRIRVQFCITFLAAIPTTTCAQLYRIVRAYNTRMHRAQVTYHVGGAICWKPNATRRELIDNKVNDSHLNVLIKHNPVN